MEEEFKANGTLSSSVVSKSELDVWRGDHGQVAEVFISITVWSICIFTVLGNALIITVFAIDRRVRGKVSNLYILNLAICDFIIGINSLLIHNLNRQIGIWSFGEVVCKLWLVLDSTSATVSVWAIVLISYDRYVLVTKGLAYDKIQTRGKFYWLAGTLWVVYGLRYGIAIIAHDFLYDTWVDYSATCDGASEYIFALVIFNLITIFCLPVVLIFVFNAIVYANIRKRTRGLPRNWASSQIAPEDDGRTESSAHPTSSNQDPGMGAREQQRHPREGTSDIRKLRRSSVTLAFIVGISALCWLPYFIYIIGNMFHISIDTTFLAATYYIWWSNALWDPLLYVATNPGIRRGVFKLLHVGK